MTCVSGSETEKGELVDALGGKLDLDSEPWPSISDAAKDLIRKMLTYDPKERITAALALGKYVYCCHVLVVLLVSRTHRYTYNHL